MTKKSSKLLFIFASFVIIVMLLTGLIQSIILTAKANYVNSLATQSSQMELENEAISSEEYQDAYNTQENHYGESGEEIYT